MNKKDETKTKKKKKRRQRKKRETSTPVTVDPTEEGCVSAHMFADQ